MAVHSFSTKDKDEKLVEDIKNRCRKSGISFSHIVIKALKEYDKCQKTQTSTTS